MTIIKVVSDIPGLTATIIDGYLCEGGELEKIWKEIHKKRRNEELHIPKNESLEYVAIGAAREAQLSLMDKVGCQLADICYLGLLKTNEENLIIQPYSQLYIEEHILERKRDKETHYFLNISKNCDFIDRCLRYMIKTINFEVKDPQKDYHYYKKLCESVKKLIKKEIFGVFISPSSVIEENLKNMGLKSIISL